MTDEQQKRVERVKTLLGLPHNDKRHDLLICAALKRRDWQSWSAASDVNRELLLNVKGI